MGRKLTFSFHPTDLPPVYAMQCDGKCLEPEIPDGAKLWFSSVELYRPGDFVLLFQRPELVPPGKHQALVKKLVLAPPPSFWTTGESGFVGLAPTVVVEMLNPRKILQCDPRTLLGIHKCLGIIPADKRTFLMDDAAVIEEAAQRRREAA